MPPQALLVTVVAVFVAVIFFVFRAIHRSHARQADVAAKSWNKADKVGDLINLYLNMALKYGPKSHEAKSFRFGVESSELWGGEKNSEALRTFNQIVEHFDDALLRNRKMFRWS